MLMPGRYVSDTSKRCMTITRSGWTTIMVDSCQPLIATATSLYTIGSATAVYNGSHLAFSAAREVDGAGFMAQVAAGVDNSFEFNVSKLDSRSEQGVLVTVLETIDNVQYVIGGGRLQLGPKQRINFRSTGNNVSLLFTGPFNMVELSQVCTKYPKSMQHTYLVDVCDEDKDRYRFGFNGMEKDNELKGVGNSLDFGARMYDSRIGKFLSLDPDFKDYAYQSPYCYAENSPISIIDIEGRGGDYYYSTYKDKNGNTQTKVIFHKDNGNGTPNRYFQLDPNANANTKNRKEQGGSFYQMTMRAESTYAPEDMVKKYGFFGDQSQFDLDRRAWLQGGDYTDKSRWQRKDDDLFDNTELDDVVTIAVIQAGMGATHFGFGSNNRGTSNKEIKFKVESNGGNKMSSTRYNKTNYKFNRGHAYDRPHKRPGTNQTTSFEGSGLTADRVEQAIVKSLDKVKDKVPQGGKGVTPYSGNVNVGGKAIEYTATKSSGGDINIGNYFIK